MDREDVSTRETILLVCKRLFNERGFGQVTTALIAAECGINEGNLYYYFKKKRDIIVELLHQYLSSLNAIEVPQGVRGHDIQPYRDYVGTIFRIMWEFRFFLRDNMAIVQTAPETLGEGKQATLHLYNNAMAILKTLKSGGLLTAPDCDLHYLAVNSLIVGAYWIDYWRMRTGSEDVTEEMFAEAFRAVETIFTPYLAVPPEPHPADFPLP